MNNLFERVKSVGFDLDNTLYPINEEIENRIRVRFAEVALEKRPDLKSVEVAREFFEKRYNEIGSRTQVLKELGFPNPEAVSKECLVKAEFLDLLKYDRKVVSLLTNIKRKYGTFLITAVPKNLSIPKLEKIGLSLSLFDYSSFGDNPEGNNKLNGSVYMHFLSQSEYSSDQHVYIGDSFYKNL
jgi:FMN phosphatase YigB (HAD superfamily)